MFGWFLGLVSSRALNKNNKLFWASFLLSGRTKGEFCVILKGVMSKVLRHVDHYNIINKCSRQPLVAELTR